MRRVKVLAMLAILAAACAGGADGELDFSPGPSDDAGADSSSPADDSGTGWTGMGTGEDGGTSVGEDGGAAGSEDAGSPGASPPGSGSIPGFDSGFGLGSIPGLDSGFGLGSIPGLDDGGLPGLPGFEAGFPGFDF